MTKYLLSIDPGVSSGLALISYDADTAPELVEGWQFTGGAAALKKWVDENDGYPTPDGNCLFFKGWDDDVTIVAEKFTARATKGFSYTTAALEPLRGEGVLLALGLMPDYAPAEKRWLDPKYQYLVGGKDLADRKKRQHAFLKDIGFYRTNKDFPDSPAKDGADDVRSAMAHGIAYLARTGHRPSFDLMTEWTESN